MKKNILIGVIIFVQISIAFCQNNQNNFPVLTGPYLGQTPPGKTPEIFAPGIINPNLHGCPVFSPDGNEAYWNLMEGGNHIIGSFVENGIWTNPQELDIFNSLNNSGEPCLSVDGNKLFVISRTSIGIGQPVKENIWYAERIPGTSHWGVPQPLSHYVNSMEMHWQMSIAENENIYFHSLASGGGDIYMSEFINGDYSNPIRLGPHVNTEEGYENTPYIAPDESYIIFSRVIWGSPEEGELFISFKIADREWSEAISMDLLNENYSSQLCPNLSPDGNYLFYISQTSQGNTTFWIDAEIIDDLNPISGTKDKTINKPVGFELNQNYPNPFSNSTLINYDLSKRSNITIELRDESAKLIKTIFKGEQNAGSYNINFNSENLSSGIYYCRMKAGDNIKTLKMIIQK